MPEYELFGARSCPHTRDMREWLDWKGCEFVEYDVEADHEARAHMIAISGGQRTVCLSSRRMASSSRLAGKGRGCVVEAAAWHELSIAMSIVELAQEESTRRGGAQVNAVHLKLGALSGVVSEALLSSWEMASFDTELRGSRLVIEKVPVVVYCPSCGMLRARLNPSSILFVPFAKTWFLRSSKAANCRSSPWRYWNESGTTAQTDRSQKERPSSERYRRARTQAEFSRLRRLRGEISLVSSPGSGKTAFLEKTLARLRTYFRVAALVGDSRWQRKSDAARLARFSRAREA